MHVSQLGFVNLVSGHFNKNKLNFNEDPERSKKPTDPA